MKKNKEIKLIFDNLKNNIILFLILNILIISGFFVFHNNTKNINTGFVDIKLVTDSFPTIDNMIENLNSYIEFASVYELHTDIRSISAPDNEEINIDEIYNLIDKYFTNYHQMLIDHKNSIVNIKSEQSTLSSINFYFQQIELFDNVFKLSKPYYEFKYNFINYITLLFSILIFLNFFLYVLISIVNQIKK